MVLKISDYPNTRFELLYKGVRALIKSLAFIVFTHSAVASPLTVTLEGELPKAVEKNILSYLGTLPTTELARSAFIYAAKDNTNKALQSLGYYQADTIVLIKEDPWQLVISITLHEPTIVANIDVQVSGEAKHDPAFITLINNHGIAPGDKLHHGKYEALKSDLLSLAMQRGYFDGELLEHTIIIRQDYRYADITFFYQSGARYRFGEVTFNNFNLEPTLLTNLIPFKPNDFFSTNNVHQLQYQLQATPYFSSVIAVAADKRPNKKSQQYTVPINVSLTSAKSHLFDFGLGYATDTEFRLSAGWRTPQINKYGHYQETKIEYSVLNPTGKFLYSIPLVHPTKDVLQLKVLIENDDYADFTTKFYSAQIGRLTSKNLWNRQLYVRLHQESWQYELDKAAPNIIWAAQDKVKYLIPGITWSKTIREGSALDPSAGFRQTYNIEVAHLNAGSDNSFFRMHGQWHYITTLKTNHRLVTRAELGVTYVDKNAQLAPSLRFYAGGDQSIRGFSYQSIGSTIPSSSDPQKARPVVIGGTRLMVASIEYQYYLSNKWRLAFFSDGGSVANKGEFKPVYSFGSGLHYISPVGAVKIDFAYGINGKDKGWRIHINLGAEL